MHAGHAEVERKKDLFVGALDPVEVGEARHQVVVVLHRVLPDPLDHQEGEAERHRAQKAADQHLAVAALGAGDRDHHGEARQEEDRGVQGADPPVELLAADDEGVGIERTVDEISHEEAAEEHDLLRQEEPHSEGRGLLLLLVAVEVVRQSRRMSGRGGMSVGHAANSSRQASSGDGAPVRSFSS